MKWDKKQKDYCEITEIVYEKCLTQCVAQSKCSPKGSHCLSGRSSPATIKNGEFLLGAPRECCLQVDPQILAILLIISVQSLSGNTSKLHQHCRHSVTWILSRSWPCSCWCPGMRTSELSHPTWYCLWQWQQGVARRRAGCLIGFLHKRLKCHPPALSICPGLT